MDKTTAVELATAALALIGTRVSADYSDTVRVTGHLSEVTIVEWQPETYDVLVYVKSEMNNEKYECLAGRLEAAS